MGKLPQAEATAGTIRASSGVCARRGAPRPTTFRDLPDRPHRSLPGILRPVLVAPTNDELLEPRHRDHALAGNRQGFRECPIKLDLILIYRKPDAETRELLRLGSHPELRV